MDKGFSRREFLRSSVLIGGLGVCSTVIAACGGGAAAPTAVPDTGKTVNITLTATDGIEFSQQKIQVDAGSTVALTFTNKSTDKLMNWVLAKPGQMLRVVTSGVVVGES